MCFSWVYLLQGVRVCDRELAKPFDFKFILLNFVNNFLNTSPFLLPNFFTGILPGDFILFEIMSKTFLMTYILLGLNSDDQK